MTALRVNRRERMHRQIWVKVNAPVDEEIAEIVSLLSAVEGLQTLKSCQGEATVRPRDRESPAYVFFHFKDWETICRFDFGVVSPALAELDADTSVRVDVFNGSEPMCKTQIRSPAAVPTVAAALQEAIYRKSPCSGDRTRKAPRNSTIHPPHQTQQPSCGGHATCRD